MSRIDLVVLIQSEPFNNAELFLFMKLPDSELFNFVEVPLLGEFEYDFPLVDCVLVNRVPPVYGVSNCRKKKKDIITDGL